MEKDIIFVAGNPNAYPLEYYDGDTETYQGAIPELLRRFSERSHYEVRYYSPSRTDRRMSLAARQQVDIVSAVENPQDISHRAGEDILLLEDGGTGGAVALCLLDVAPEGLDGELRAFVSAVSQREWTGLVVQAARGDPPQDRLLIHNVFFGLILAAAVLAAALVWAAAFSRRRMEKLRREREIDLMTGIGNRNHLQRHFRTRVHDQNRILYTMFCFEALPAAGGDEAACLRHVAAALQNSASDMDILARVSDNGFALLRLCSGGRESVEWLAAVLSCLKEDGGSRVAEVTAGAYPLKADDRDLDTILSRGLRTAQIAREREAGYQFFDGEVLRTVQTERRLQAGLQEGLENQEFQLRLQFYVDARTGRAVGAEVLLLWEHPELGALPPSQWRPLMDREGLSSQMDCYVLERACAFLDHLRQNGREDFFLLYSLSEQTLFSEELEGQWKEATEAYHFDPGRLIFGLSRNSSLWKRDGRAYGLEAIRSMGMGIVLDSFDGQMIRLVQAGEARLFGLKLSRELTDWVGQPLGRTVFRFMFQAGHALKLALLAENVSSEDQAGCLRELGCDLLRGDLYARPLPAWEAMRKLVGRTAGKEV